MFRIRVIGGATSEHRRGAGTARRDCRLAERAEPNDTRGGVCRPTCDLEGAPGVRGGTVG